MLKYQELISKMTLEEKCYMFSGGNFWQSRSVKRLGIPPMVMSDGPHGVRKQEGAGDQLGLNGSLKATCFPSSFHSFGRVIILPFGYKKQLFAQTFASQID